MTCSEEYNVNQDAATIDKTSLFTGYIQRKLIHEQAPKKANKHEYLYHMNMVCFNDLE